MIVNPKTIATEIEWLIDGESTNYSSPDDLDLWVGPNKDNEFELSVETSNGEVVKTFVVSIREGTL